MNKEKLESSKNLFFIALGIDIVITVMVVMSDFWGLGVLKDINTGRITADQSLISTLEFWDSFAKLMLLTILGVGLGLVKWLNTCYSYAKETIGASGFKNEGWTAGGWIIPIFNLFKPYQVINEIFKAGNPTYVLPDGWKKESGSGLLLAWWIFWAVTHVIGCVVGKQMFNSAMRDDMTLQQSIGAIEFHAWFCVVFLVVSGLWLVVAGNLTRRLLARGSTAQKNYSQVKFELLPNRAAMQSQLRTTTQASSVSPALQQSIQNHIASKAPKASTDSADPSSQNTPDASAEEGYWAIAMAEMEVGPRRTGVWAKAFSESEGDEAKAKAAYLKVRVQQLNEETCANRAVELREAEKVAETQQLLIILEQFVKNAWVTVESLKAIVWGLDPDVLKSVVVEATSDTLLHVCVHYRLEREVHRLMEIGVNPERRNLEKMIAADIAPTSSILLLLLGMAVMLNKPNELNIVDVPSSITKIMTELTKRNYVFDGRVIREPHGGKFRFISEYELIKYAYLKLDFSAAENSH